MMCPVSYNTSYSFNNSSHQHPLIVTGNKGKQIEFETLCGVLTVKQNGKLITMDIPCNVGVPLSETEWEKLSVLMGEVLCGLAVQDVHLSRTLKYLHLRLAKSHSRYFEAIFLQFRNAVSLMFISLINP